MMTCPVSELGKQSASQVNLNVLPILKIQENSILRISCQSQIRNMPEGPKADFLKALGFASDLDDEDISNAVSVLISAAVHDDTPEKPLEVIYHTLSQFDGISYLDPLSVLPILLPSGRPESSKLVSMIGYGSSAKEVMIAVQESVEQLKSSLESSEDQEYPETSVQQIINTLTLCTAFVPRLKLGKRTAYTTIAPLVSDLQRLISSAGVPVSRNQGRQLINDAARLVKVLYIWATSSSSLTETTQTKELLINLMNAAVSTCSSWIQSTLAARLFEARFPRLVLSSAVEAGWEEGDQAIVHALDALAALEVSANSLIERPSLNNLIYLAHSPTPLPPPLSVLSDFLPYFLLSIQRNVALDETLFLLLDSLLRLHSRLPRQDLPADIVSTLLTVLPALSSTHPDPFVRHLTLRLISLLLSMSPQHLRLEILADLTSGENFPQMRAAAIGLLKEAVLEGLTLASASNVFASKVLLQVFGGVLFRTTPTDFLSIAHNAEEIQESLEPGRIVECLSFYYVLLQRDRENKTGVRDVDFISSVESSLLRPLRLFLQRWTQDTGEPLLPVISLQLSLDRVDDAVRALRY
ncbi:hypothetical protein BV22DRAFT_474169 [Leucogyrophana mollusca]|uniref:Uncharacterized protein n=1 Tax=Leucogyrophana mollusca TaxID=85980 RepID=A0ACB8BHD7_9AGAM|nr:hypothetical protein BV22DRAFT_474169 [Leucogyrophana mollusca]